ncbi:hypothetical protein EKK58_07925 [Candidatus Dependentiae bacterium]|nr:MAG: hypothetical protein EKK58_07925 [Candidatus Dependentiae bacterium]
MQIVLPEIKLSGSRIQIICDSNNESAFNTWDKLASMCPDVPQSKQDAEFIKSINKTFKKNKNHGKKS